MMDIGVVRVALILWLVVAIGCTMTNTTEDEMCAEIYMCVGEVDIVSQCQMQEMMNQTDGSASGLWMCDENVTQFSEPMNCSQFMSLLQIYNCSNTTQSTTTTVSAATPSTTVSESAPSTTVSESAPSTTDGKSDTTTTSQPTTVSTTARTMPIITTTSGMEQITSAASSQSVEDRTTKTPDSEPLVLTQIVLYAVLGFLLLLVLSVLVMILCVAACYCRSYRKRKHSIGMDMLSKWEDTPAETSDIKLVSVKSVGDSEDKDGEKEKLSDMAESKEGDVKKDESKGDEGEKKGNDITLGTFGFPEVVIEPTASKTDIQVAETEMKENEKIENKNQKEAVEVKEKNENNSAPNKRDMECSTPDKQGTLESTVAKDKQSPIETVAKSETANTVELNKENGNKLEPVPVNIPVFGKQEEDKKPGNASSDVQPLKKFDQTASPTKEKAPTVDQSSTSSKEAMTMDKDSKETLAAAATTTQAQTVDNTTLLVSDKLPSDIGGQSLLSSEDTEKALGVTVKDSSLDAATQL